MHVSMAFAPSGQNTFVSRCRTSVVAQGLFSEHEGRLHERHGVRHCRGNASWAITSRLAALNHPGCTEACRHEREMAFWGGVIVSAASIECVAQGWEEIRPFGGGTPGGSFQGTRQADGSGEFRPGAFALPSGIDAWAARLGRPSRVAARLWRKRVGWKIPPRRAGGSVRTFPNRRPCECQSSE